MGKILVLGTSTVSMVGALLAKTDTLENAVEPAEDTSPLPGGDPIVIDTNGDRSDEAMAVANLSLPAGYEIVSVSGGWKLSRMGVIVDYYDGIVI